MISNTKQQMKQGQLTAAVQHPVAVQTILCRACALDPAWIFPKDVFYVDIFLLAEIRLPGWFVITKDGFLQKTADVRSCRKSCLADRGS